MALTASYLAELAESKLAAQSMQSRETVPHKFAASRFLSETAATALDQVMDGFFLVTAAGQIVMSNAKGDRIFPFIQPDPAAQNRWMPKSIIVACKLLLSNSDYLSEQSLPSQVVLTAYPGIKLRISLLETDDQIEPLFLVTVEDQRQNSLTQAIVDQWLYGLTNREKEVWILRLQNYSYIEIASTLFLSINTVKKHMKTILAKQEDWRLRMFGAMAS